MANPKFRRGHFWPNAKIIGKDEKLSFILRKTDETIQNKNNQ